MHIDNRGEILGPFLDVPTKFQGDFSAQCYYSVFIAGASDITSSVVFPWLQFLRILRAENNLWSHQSRKTPIKRAAVKAGENIYVFALPLSLCPSFIQGASGM
jgi:hypothetical protein